MLTHPTLDQLNALGLHGMAKAFDKVAQEPEVAGCQRRSQFPQNRRSKIPQFRRSAHRVGVAIFRWPAAWPRRLGDRGRRDQRLGPNVFGHELGVLTQAIA